MSRDILQRFLSRRLFEIGGDDTRLDRLRRAAGDLGSSLIEEPTRTMRYALVAFDPDVPVDDPVLDEVADAVEQHWNTYAGCFADRPRTLLRAVLLEALRQAAGRSVGIAAAIALSARNLLPHLNLGAEQDIWRDLFAESEERLDERARAEWSLGVESVLPAIGAMDLGVDRAASMQKTDRKALSLAFQAASGPQNQQSQSLPNPNPNWPNSGPPWSYEFAPRAAQAVADAIDKATSGALHMLPGLGNTINDGVQAVLNEVLATVVRGTHGVRRRTELLWWRAALYSPSARVSYRSLSSAGAAALMAIDLHRQVPAFCPASVEFFLRETVALAIDAEGASSAKPLRKLLTEIGSGTSSGVVREILTPFRQSSGRGPMIGLIADLLGGGRATGDRFGASVGVGGDLKFTAPELAVWLFRELQGMAAAAVPTSRPATDQEDSPTPEPEDSEEEDEP